MKKRLIGLAVLLALVAVVGAGVWYFLQDTGDSRTADTTSRTDTLDVVGDEASNRVDVLLNEKPADDATTEEKVEYYNEVLLFAQNSGRCDDVVAALEDLEAVTEERAPINTIFIAECYFNNQGETELVDRYIAETKKRVGALPDTDNGNQVREQVEGRIALLEARR